MKLSDSGTDSDDSGSASSSSSDSDNCSSESSIDYDCEKTLSPASKRQCRRQPSRHCKSDYKRSDSSEQQETPEEVKNKKVRLQNLLEISKKRVKRVETSIVKLSKADNWEQAKMEWSTSYIYRNTNKVDYCICLGKTVPDHLVVIRNRQTHKTVKIDVNCLPLFETFRLSIDADCWLDLECLEESASNHSVDENFLWLACKSKVLQRWEVTSYLKITKNLDYFIPQHKDFSVEYYQWRLIVNARLRYGFHCMRPHCNCGEDVAAVAKYTTSPRKGSHNDYYFYACPRYKSKLKPGCGFYKICAYLSV